MTLPHNRIVCDALAATKWRDDLCSAMLRPASCFADISRQLAASQKLIAEITAPYSNVLASLQEQLSVFNGISASIARLPELRLSIPQFSSVASAWNLAGTGMANHMREIGLFAQRETLAARLFTASSTYTAFVQRTADRLAAATTPETASILRGSLSLAENQFLGITDGLSDVLAVPDDDDEPSSVRDLAAPFDQQEELLTLGNIGDEQDTQALIELCPTAQTVERSKRMLQLVTQCNEASRSSPIGAEIFKPTTRLLEVFHDLPWLTVTDRSRFAEFVDCLYFIFYEGAGKDKLRFLAANGGPLDDGECELIWCIKHLRNKWTRHDADHGKEKDIQKAWADLADKMRWLGLAQFPTDPQHFRILHNRLLDLAADFLAQILGKLGLN
jgi:hypothetical protein